MVRFELVIRFLCFEYAKNPADPQRKRLLEITGIFDELLASCPPVYPEMLHNTVVDFLRIEASGKPYLAPSWAESQVKTIVELTFPPLKAFLEHSGVSIFDTMLESTLSRHDPLTIIDRDKAIQTLVNLMPVPCGKYTVLRLWTQGLLMSEGSNNLLATPLGDEGWHRLYRVFHDRRFLGHLSQDSVLEDSLSIDLGL
jgi:hypothetical protein